LSSLLVRTIPTSVAPPLTICKASPRCASADNRTCTPTGCQYFTLTVRPPPRKPLRPTDYSLLGHRPAPRRAHWFRRKNGVLGSRSPPSVRVRLACVESGPRNRAVSAAAPPSRRKPSPGARRHLERHTRSDLGRRRADVLVFALRYDLGDGCARF